MNYSIDKNIIKRIVELEGYFDSDNNYIRFNDLKNISENDIDLMIKTIKTKFKRGRPSKENNIKNKLSSSKSIALWNKLIVMKKRFDDRKTKKEPNPFHNKFSEFLDWWLNPDFFTKDEGLKCYYCESTERQWAHIYQNAIEKDSDEYDTGKYHKSEKNSFNSPMLEIDKMNPKHGYNPSNCVFACHFCNNDKSDLIGEKEFKKYFKSAIQGYTKYLAK